LDGNGHLDSEELFFALEKAGKLLFSYSVRLWAIYINNFVGIVLEPSTLTEFMTSLTSSPHSHAISFSEFRDFLLLLPRKISAAEIYRYYEVKRFMGDDGRGAARVTMEGQSLPLNRFRDLLILQFSPGDVSLSAEDKPPFLTTRLPQSTEANGGLIEQDIVDNDDLFEEEEEHHPLDGHTAFKFLLAGGIAGAGELADF
jgi:solute carrier family 25 phosphate transporter 23/24/25/41